MSEPREMDVDRMDVLRSDEGANRFTGGRLAELFLDRDFQAGDADRLRGVVERLTEQDTAQDPDQAAREWAQNSADNDSRRWLAANLLGAGPGVYGAACVLADLGPRGSKATRSDREDAIRVLLTEMSKDRSHISRCPVEASDVETAGVTHVGCWRWFRRLGFSQSGPTATCGFFHLIGNWGPVVAHGYVHTSWTSEDIVRLVNTTSWRAPAATVLDEMAALENDAEV